MNMLEPGFYANYKHDPSGQINNNVYEFLNVGHDTEVDGLELSAKVIYRPLYESTVYLAGKHWDIKSLALFTGKVDWQGATVARFTRITDPMAISELEKIRDRMYLES